MEDVEAFRARARAWIPANLEPLDPENPVRQSVARGREVQRKLFDGGFAGIAMPKEYGGQGLTFDHQKAFAEEAAGYEMPVALNVSIGMMIPTLLDHASEDMKARHVPAILKGEEVWIQLLSEPSGGSDMAAVLTRATKDGDAWILSGSKIWSTDAHHADYGMCLARSDWDAPKHKGLSMFAVPFGVKGMVVEQIKTNVNIAHFCQEFLDDVQLGPEAIIGHPGQGWSVAHSLLFHERNATAGVAHGTGYSAGTERSGAIDLVAAISHVRARGGAGDAHLRQAIAEAHITSVVQEQVGQRVMVGMKTGAFKGDWGSLLKLGLGVDSPRLAEIGLIAAGADGVIWPEDCDGEGTLAYGWLESKVISIAGGTNEMQRNIVSERLMGLPRDPDDRDLPFSQVLARRRAKDGGHRP